MMPLDRQDPVAPTPRSAHPSPTFRDVPTTSVAVQGVRFVYRRLGPDTGIPVVFLHHLSAVLDNWDPRVIDGIAAERPVIVFDNRGVGASEGTTPSSIEAMASDAIACIRALGFAQVDLVGLSMGGFVAQVIVQQAPQLVRKLILAGTGPAGGIGIDRVTSLTIRDTLKGLLTFKDPKYYLFFTRTANGKAAAQAFLKRLRERTRDRDTPISLRSFRAHLAAVHAWGLQPPADLSGISHPVLVVNGDHDRMVPTSNSVELARRIPHARLILYPDAGHGGIFQHHEAFVRDALLFLTS